MRDLRKCGVEENWKELSLDRDKWREIVNSKLAILNEEAEKAEEEKKDDMKRRREQQNQCEGSQSAQACNEPGCGFVARNRAGLINHQRQKHSLQV